MDKSTFPDVKLTVTDVPGAQLVYESIERHSKLQLKRWLECRGLPRSGLKQELVDR